MTPQFYVTLATASCPHAVLRSGLAAIAAALTVFMPPVHVHDPATAVRARSVVRTALTSSHAGSAVFNTTNQP
jgi:hypothetical protein